MELIQVKELFYLRKDLQNRIIPICPARDEAGNFYTWIQRKEGLQQIRPLKPIEAIYFSKEVDSQDDFYFEFMNFMYQKSFIKDVYPILSAIGNDAHNLAACFEKLQLFHRVSIEQKVDVNRFVTTEIEYIFGVCRSLFDLFQFIAKKYWNNIQLIDSSIRKRELKDSFSEMVFNGANIKSSEELQKKFGLPAVWAEFYVREAQFFNKIRTFRDDIHHRGLTPDIIFNTEKGFAIAATYKPFACFDVWKEESFLPNQLAPVKPIIAFVVKETFDMMTRYTAMASRIIKFPEDIAPGYSLFIRGYHIYHLGRLKDYVERNVWFIDE